MVSNTGPGRRLQWWQMWQSRKEAVGGRGDGPRRHPLVDKAAVQEGGCCWATWWPKATTAVQDESALVDSIAVWNKSNFVGSTAVQDKSGLVESSLV